MDGQVGDAVDRIGQRVDDVGDDRIVPLPASLIQPLRDQLAARDELRAINDIRVKQGLPALDERGQPQGENHVYQAR